MFPSYLHTVCLFRQNNSICASDAQRNVCFVYDMEIPGASVKHQNVPGTGCCLEHLCQGLQGGFPTQTDKAHPDGEDMASGGVELECSRSRDWCRPGSWDRKEARGELGGQEAIKKKKRECSPEGQAGIEEVNPCGTTRTKRMIPVSSQDRTVPVIFWITALSHLVERTCLQPRKVDGSGLWMASHASVGSFKIIICVERSQPFFLYLKKEVQTMKHT